MDRRLVIQGLVANALLPVLAYAHSESSQPTLIQPTSSQGDGVQLQYGPHNKESLEAWNAAGFHPQELGEGELGWHIPDTWAVWCRFKGYDPATAFTPFEAGATTECPDQEARSQNILLKSKACYKQAWVELMSGSPTGIHDRVDQLMGRPWTTLMVGDDVPIRRVDTDVYMCLRDWRTVISSVRNTWPQRA